MTVLSTNDRINAWAEYIQQLSEEMDMSTGTLLDEARAAVDATDGWLDDNQVSYSNALPAAFKTWATSRHKAQLLMLVVLRRFNVESWSED